MKEDEITGKILEAAFKVHTALGPGLLESVYEITLAHELRKRGVEVERQVDIPIIYDGLKFEVGFRADLIVNGSIIVELKSVEALTKVHCKQLLTQLRLSNKRLGLLLNFSSLRLRDGIVRMVNDPRQPSADTPSF